MAELYGIAANVKEACVLMDQGVKMIQYRNKYQSHSDVVRSVKEILQYSGCHDHVNVIVNDSLEAALASGAHGVHLGQDDGDAESVCRHYGGDLIIGVSVDSVEEAVMAQNLGASYLGAGAVYGSETKPEAPLMGVSLLEDICRNVTLPVCAIGGITLEKTEEIYNAGASFICAVSDISNHANPSERIGEYQKILEELNEK